MNSELVQPVVSIISNCLLLNIKITNSVGVFFNCNGIIFISIGFIK